MNVIPFDWQPYNDAVVSYYATDGFPLKLRYQTLLEGELPTERNHPFGSMLR
jgi:hypothetical protein